MPGDRDPNQRGERHPQCTAGFERATHRVRPIARSEPFLTSADGAILTTSGRRGTRTPDICLVRAAL